MADCREAPKACNSGELALEFHPIISLGRIAPGAIVGAAQTAQALENLYDVRGQSVGSAAPTAEG